MKDENKKKTKKKTKSRKKTRKEQRNKSFYIVLIFRIISILIIAICLFILYLWNKDNNKNNTLQNNLNSYIITEKNSRETQNEQSTPFDNIHDENRIPISYFDVDFESLLKQNSDCVGWIRILGTNINFPIVQTQNNDYYLNHNIAKESNGAGWIFADYRNNFEELNQNTIIYGHNRRNGTMFSNLKYYLDENFCAYEEHKYINFNTLNKQYIAEVFSAYKISANNSSINTDYESYTEFSKVIQDWKNKSVYNFNVDVDETDNILTLYTCDNNTSYRILLHAKIIPIN